jgi:hypothetical protein
MLKVLGRKRKSLRSMTEIAEVVTSAFAYILG